MNDLPVFEVLSIWLSLVRGIYITSILQKVLMHFLKNAIGFGVSTENNTKQKDIY